MPGLLRGVARTAVVAGTATAVSNRVSRRQANRWAQQESQQAYASGYGPPARYEGQQYAYPDQGQPEPPPPPPPAPAASTTDRLDQLARLGELKSQGVLTEAEFEEQKRRILA
jgi:hypothetical protein